MNTTLPQVEIYTDGACDPNPGPGGWAAILSSGPHHKEISGANPDTTNNQMELQAVIEALNTLKGPSQVTLYTDSQYVRQGITEWIDNWQAKGWRTSAGKPVKNQALWQALRQAMARHTIDWRWVKGHAGNPLNERADRLAAAQIPRPTPADDHEAAIYIGVSCQQKSGQGAWVALCQVGETLIEHSGRQTNTTANQLLIQAAFEGLRILPLNLIVRVFTTADYLQKGGSLWLDGWQQRNWKTKEGQPVANSEQWQALAAQLELRTVTWFNPKATAPDAPPPELTQAAERAEALMRAMVGG